jgi:hypothetical protein
MYNDVETPWTMKTCKLHWYVTLIFQDIGQLVLLSLLHDIFFVRRTQILSPGRTKLGKLTKAEDPGFRSSTLMTPKVIYLA